MIALSSTRPDGRARADASRVRVVSPDVGFASAIHSWLDAWGLSVAVESDFSRLTPAIAAEERLDVVVLDVRGGEDALLGWLAALKRALPAVEVVLLGRPGDVATSIAAMRAGASAELSAPVDLSALRRAVSAALRRRSKRLHAAKPSLLERFHRALSAATFAQAGEFETARELLADGEPRGRGARGGTSLHSG
jgi:DNA-binding NtrC family response regulator